jgi:STE24 endopeptidase
VSRFLLLFLFILWTAWPRRDPRSPEAMSLELVLFLGFFALLVGVLGMWARLLARRVNDANLHRSLKRFNKTMHYARLMVPAWFAVGVFALGWGSVVEYLLLPVKRYQFELPGVIVGTLPAMLAWMGLWWSQFPADRALREQSLLIQLDAGMPVHAPPRFWPYFVSNLRLQLLFTVVPVLLILVAHDVASGILWRMGWLDRVGTGTQAGISLASATLVFLFAPEILRRVLHTQPLPASSLRDRLETLCRRHGLRYREILLWRTDHNMGNAAVMGLVPQVRYILLSDLLLETMTDAQIEAVFAHEVGHIVHRHMAWYVVFFLLLMATMAGPGEDLLQLMRGVDLPGWLPEELVISLASVGLFFLAFGFLSRRFERQADVFAARTMEREGEGFRVQGSGHARSPAASSSSPEPRTPNPEPSHVGPYGAAVFASALRRVATINNIPVAARSWCHGSIATRMRALENMSADPGRTSRFDRVMRRLYVALLAALVCLGTWAFIGYAARAESDARTEARTSANRL